jgi:hypothetical protein
MAELTGVYVITYPDGRTEDWQGHDLPGMIRDAAKRGAESVTDPDGTVHGSDELAATGWDPAPDEEPSGWAE